MKIYFKETKNIFVARLYYKEICRDKRLNFKKNLKILRKKYNFPDLGDETPPRSSLDPLMTSKKLKIMEILNLIFKRNVQYIYIELLCGNI